MTTTPYAAASFRADATPARAGGPAANVTLTVTKEGRGTITSSPAGISCGTTCTGSFPQGTTLTLTPAPDPDYNFGLWGGACSNTPFAPVCTVRLNSSTSVVGAFIGVDVNDAKFATTWTQSVLTRATLTIHAVASHVADLTATVSSAAGKTVTGHVSVAAPGGAFTLVIRLPSKGFLPGSYGLQFTGTILGRPFQGSLIGLRMTAPKEGVVSQAWVSPFGSSARVKRLPRGTTAMTAYFVYSAKPFVGSKIVATWYWNGRVAKQFPIPRFLPVAQATLRVSSGGALPAGSYKCVLVSRSKVLKIVTVVVA